MTGAKYRSGDRSGAEEWLGWSCEVRFGRKEGSRDSRLRGGCDCVTMRRPLVLSDGSAVPTVLSCSRGKQSHAWGLGVTRSWLEKVETETRLAGFPLKDRTSGSQAGGLRRKRQRQALRLMVRSRLLFFSGFQLFIKSCFAHSRDVGSLRPKSVAWACAGVRQTKQFKFRAEQIGPITARVYARDPVGNNKSL